MKALDWLTPKGPFLTACGLASTVSSWLPVASGEDNGERCQVWVGSFIGCEPEYNSAPWWFVQALLLGRDKIGDANAEARKSSGQETMSPGIKWSFCPAFVCRWREVKRTVLSRVANLWSYLQDKSIAVSESRADCAWGESWRGYPRAPPGGYLPVSSPSISSASVLTSCNYPPPPSPVTSCDIYALDNRGSTLSKMLYYWCR